MINGNYTFDGQPTPRSATALLEKLSTPIVGRDDGGDESEEEEEGVEQAHRYCGLAASGWFGRLASYFLI